jgi:UDP-N-acetylglucosamine 2-epimerase (hydrolysing)
MRKLLFVTGTRADFGKLKPLIRESKKMPGFTPEIFVTGMHMLQRFGSTWEEVVWSDLAPVHPFVNQSPGDTMDVVLAKTVMGLSDFVKESRPDLIIVHGDRVEALAGAIVGSLSNIRVAHIEGGELSGTVDEVLRHAVSKLSHWHFVSNNESEARLLQLGESENRVFVIGSPDIDIMDSPDLPSKDEAFQHYDLDYEAYGILIFHPVTTEIAEIEMQTRTLMRALVEAGHNMIVIESNNDDGSEHIRGVYEEFRGENNFRFFPSVRFEFFLSILKSARFMIGNSSAGIREAPHYGVPAINLGSRQLNRVVSKLVINCELEEHKIVEALLKLDTVERVPEHNFGTGNSAEAFRKILANSRLWDGPVQKQFVDIEKGPRG